jgi:hypothetical protein
MKGLFNISCNLLVATLCSEMIEIGPFGQSIIVAKFGPTNLIAIG